MKSKTPQNVCLGEAALNRPLIETIRFWLPKREIDNPVKITQKARTK